VLRPSPSDCSLFGGDAVNPLVSLRHPWKKERGATLLFCPGFLVQLKHYMRVQLHPYASISSLYMQLWLVAVIIDFLMGNGPTVMENVRLIHHTSHVCTTYETM
jgi:hypothetical protein